MLPLLLTSLGVLVVLVVFVLVLVARFYRKVDQGFALIVNTMKDEPTVTFTGAIVIPVLHRAEVMDISVKTIEIDRRGKDGLICQDNIRADIKVTFFVRVNKTRDDVLKVAQSIGCKRASDHRTLEELFAAKFSEALKTVGKRLDFEDLYLQRSKFRDDIMDVIGKDLNGFVLDDAAIDYLEQTPIEALDPENILDSQGIRKITEITTGQNVLTNDFKQTERKSIKKQNVEAEEAILELDRQQADAEAKQKREIAVVRFREQAEIDKVQSEEAQRSQLARIKMEEQVAIEEENKQRQIEVATKQRERVIAVETERVTKDRDLEAISREREVELQRIDKEKALEAEKKAIADIIRERVAVDKTVAEEEERIKDLRAVAEAKRNKDVVVISAEAEAQQGLVKSIKAAEAQEEVAKFQAREKLTIAQADLDAADKDAQAKIRIAEGTQAEVAAKGLGEVRVKEAEAAAIEKVGGAEARVTLEKMQAEAAGEEKKGFARAKVMEAEAAAIEKQGLAEAIVVKEKALAEAAGAREKGLAEVNVKEAEAAAIEKQGLAEASAIKEKMAAEASGLAEKANAMKALDGVGKEHEEFRLRLEKQKEVELAAIATRRDIASAQAEVLRAAFHEANFNIVGGDGAFFERFIKAVSVGQSMDGFLNNSESARTLLQDYLTGDSSLPADVRDVLSRPALDAEGVQQISVAAFLAKLMTEADGPTKTRLSALLERARELGLTQKGQA
jgi:uncharacterized membrane protein YqiK